MNDKKSHDIVFVEIIRYVKAYNYIFNRTDLIYVMYDVSFNPIWQDSLFNQNNDQLHWSTYIHWHSNIISLITINSYESTLPPMDWYFSFDTYFVLGRMEYDDQANTWLYFLQTIWACTVKRWNIIMWS